MRKYPLACQLWIKQISMRWKAFDEAGDVGTVGHIFRCHCLASFKAARPGSAASQPPRSSSGTIVWSEMT